MSGQTESAMSYEMEWKQGVEHIPETWVLEDGEGEECKVILCRSKETVFI